MAIFRVTRSLTAAYEDESEDKTVVVTVRIDATDLDDLHEILFEEDFEDEEWKRDWENEEKSDV